MVEAEREENPAWWEWQETLHAGNWDSKKKQQKAQSQIPEGLQLR